MSEGFSDVSPASPELDDISTESESENSDEENPIDLQKNVTYQELSSSSPVNPSHPPQPGQRVTQISSTRIQSTTSRNGVSTLSSVSSIPTPPPERGYNVAIGEEVTIKDVRYRVAECSDCVVCIKLRNAERLRTESQTSLPVAETSAQNDFISPFVSENTNNVPSSSLPTASLSNVPTASSTPLGNPHLSKGNEGQASAENSSSDWIGTIGDISESDDEWNPNVAPQKKTEPKNTSKAKKTTTPQAPSAKVINVTLEAPVPTKGILKPTRSLEHDNPVRPGVPTPSEVLKRLLYGANTNTPTSRTPRCDRTPDAGSNADDADWGISAKSSTASSRNQSLQLDPFSATTSMNSSSVIPKSYSERRYSSSSQHSSREKYSRSVRREYGGGGSSRRNARPTRWDNDDRTEKRREKSRSPYSFEHARNLDKGSSKSRNGDRTPYGGGTHHSSRSRRSRSRSHSSGRRWSSRRSSRRSRRSESQSSDRRSSPSNREGYASSTRQISSRRAWARDMENTSRRSQRRQRDHSSDSSPAASRRRSQRSFGSRRSERRTPGNSKKRQPSTRTGPPLSDWRDSDDEFVTAFYRDRKSTSGKRSSDTRPEDEGMDSTDSDTASIKTEVDLDLEKTRQGNILVSLPNMANSDPQQRTVQLNYSQGSAPKSSYRSTSPNYSCPPPRQSMQPPRHQGSTSSSVGQRPSTSGASYEHIQRTFGVFSNPGDTDEDTASEVSTIGRNIPDETVECLAYSSIVKDRCTTCYELTHVTRECNYLKEVRDIPGLKSLMEARRKRYFDENPEIRKAARVALRSLEQRPKSRCYQDELGLSGRF